jgi:hypothetical protein
LVIVISPANVNVPSIIISGYVPEVKFV